MEEVRALAAGANVAHGKGNTEADYHNIIKRLMALGDVYMENSFIPDIKKIAESIGAAIPRVRTGYSNYFPNGGLSLRQICVEKRDAAILEKHKEGLSNRKIAELFGIGSHVTVANILDEQVVKNGDSPKMTTQSSPSVLPLANAEDRAETRVDADDFVDSFLSDYDDYISLAEDETESEPAPTFDLKAATGFGDDIANYTKRDKAEDAAPWNAPEVTATPVDLQDAWLALLEEEEAATAAYNAKMADIAARKAPVKQQADAKGISLPA